MSVVFNGKNMSLAELSDLCGKSIQVLHWRINKMNMTPQEAATKPMLRMRQGKKPGSNDAGKAAHYAEKLTEITASNDW